MFLHHQIQSFLLHDWHSFCISKCCITMDMKQKQRGIIEFLISDWCTAACINRRLRNVYSDATIDESNVQRWVKCLKKTKPVLKTNHTLSTTLYTGRCVCQVDSSSINRWFEKEQTGHVVGTVGSIWSPRRHLSQKYLYWWWDLGVPVWPWDQ